MDCFSLRDATSLEIAHLGRLRIDLQELVGLFAREQKGAFADATRPVKLAH